MTKRDHTRFDWRAEKDASGPGGAPVGTRSLKTQEIGLKALQLRIGGMGWEDIADRLGVHPAVAFDSVKAIRAARDQRADELAAEYQALQIDQLSTLLQGIWRAAQSGEDLPALDRAVMLIDKLAKVSGVYARVEQQAKAAPVATGEVQELRDEDLIKLLPRAAAQAGAIGVIDDTGIDE